MALKIQLPPMDPLISPAASPPSRPHSRPSSRSERLLRDTLRKADQQRQTSPSLSSRRAPSDVDIHDLLDDNDNNVNNVPHPLPPSLDTASPPHPLTRIPTTSPAYSPTHRSSHSLSAIPVPSPNPHHREAVLRARLENVLGRVSSHPNAKHARTRSLNISPIVTDWPWTPSPESTEEQPPTAPLTPPPTPPPTTVAPMSTPPSPFNARAASQICRQLPGYVSFQDVEGLGEPPETDESDVDREPASCKSDSDRSLKWWNWPWAGRARAQSR